MTWMNEDVSRVLSHPQRLVTWAGEQGVTNGDETFPGLLMITGVIAFMIGALLGAQVLMGTLRRRDEQQADERRVLNHIWRHLKAEFGIDKAAWMADFLDRQRRSGT